MVFLQVQLFYCTHLYLNISNQWVKNKKKYRAFHKKPKSSQMQNLTTSRSF